MSINRKFNKMSLNLLIHSLYLSGLFINCIIPGGEGLRCYKCETIDVQSRCAANNGGVVQCKRQFCTLFRREKSDSNIPFYLSRNCSDETEPPVLNDNFNEFVENKVYYRFCSTDLCNSGDGIDHVTSRPVIVVPGESSSPGLAPEFSAEWISVILVILIRIIF